MPNQVSGKRVGTFRSHISPFRLVGCSAGVLLLALPGCATVFDGTSQEISVNTNPPGATCVFTRNGMTIGTIPSTPALISVEKRKYDILITCNKTGYAQSTYLNHSGVSAAIAGNIAADIILTAGLSSIVDSADGADNKYDSAVNISLSPAQSSTSVAANLVGASVVAQPIPAAIPGSAPGQATW